MLLNIEDFLLVVRPYHLMLVLDHIVVLLVLLQVQMFLVLVWLQGQEQV